MYLKEKEPYLCNIIQKNVKMEFLTILGIIFSFMFASILLLNLRHWITGEPFRGTCSSNNPMLKDQLGDCTLCGKKADEACQMPKVQ